MFEFQIFTKFGKTCKILDYFFDCNLYQYFFMPKSIKFFYVINKRLKLFNGIMIVTFFSIYHRYMNLCISKVK